MQFGGFWVLRKWFWGEFGEILWMVGGCSWGFDIESVVLMFNLLSF